MPLTRYQFRLAASSFHEMSTKAARELLPRHLEPLELRHGRGVFAITAFDFTDSMAGPYQEIVLAVIVPPIMKPGGEIPKSAFYPFLVATSTEASREHAIERWHLPHYMKDISVDFDESDSRIRVNVHEAGKPIIDFAISDHAWHSVDHLYQSFMIDGDARFRVDVHMKGSFTEHEEETGEIELHNHPMCTGILNADVESYPFRELWMRDGVQTFEELMSL